MDTLSTSTPYNRAIKNLDTDDRPREKALKNGIGTLTNAELLALLLGTGTPGESVIDLCQRILNYCDNKLYRLARFAPADLSRNFKGIGPAKAVTILAAMELSRRYHDENFEEQPQLRDSATAYNYIRGKLRDINHEEFWLIALNRAKRITGCYRVSQGGLAATVVDVKMVMKTALDHLADSIIVAHNHPSGNCRPGGEDNNVTRRLREACQMLDMQLVDHIIVAGGSYYSYNDEGMLE